MLDPLKPFAWNLWTNPILRKALKFQNLLRWNFINIVLFTIPIFFWRVEHKWDRDNVTIIAGYFTLIDLHGFILTSIAEFADLGSCKSCKKILICLDSYESILTSIADLDSCISNKKILIYLDLYTSILTSTANLGSWISNRKIRIYLDLYESILSSAAYLGFVYIFSCLKGWPYSLIIKAQHLRHIV